MLSRVAMVVAALLLAPAGFLLATPDAARAHSGELLLGFNGGPGLQVNFTATDFLTALPLAARVGVGYTVLAPGQADGARRIFINDATNGVPQKRGWAWDYRFDLVYPVGERSAWDLLLFGGPRYSRYTANFKYFGGNEDFDVTSHQWGFGVGVESPQEISASTELVVQAGVDYYFDSFLYGHDTSYSSDGQHVNPRDDYGWADADAVIDQPGLGVRLMAGLRHHF
jgi:hypothetical protein